MTVKELIKVLEVLPEEAEVLTETGIITGRSCVFMKRYQTKSGIICKAGVALLTGNESWD